MRHRGLRALVVAGLVAACGSDTTSGSSPSLPVTVVNRSSGSGQGGAHLEFVTFEVTDRDTQQPLAGALIVLQVTAGDLSPLPLVTGSNGRATVTWTIPPADQTPGTIQVMAFCAPPPGKSFCRTRLSDPDAVRVQF